MRPVPKVRLPQNEQPSSPPQSPTTMSTAIHHAIAAKSAGIAGMPFRLGPGVEFVTHDRPTAGTAVPNSHPTRPIRPEDLSPQSSSSSMRSLASKSDGSHVASSLRTSGNPDVRTSPALQASASSIIAEASFTIEELSDFGGSADDANVDIIRPHAIEYVESDRSRSESRDRPARPGVDRKMVHHFNNLNCSDDSENSDINMDELEYQRFLLKRREDRGRRRMTSGSIGKRTISESIGSDSDREDLPGLDVNEVGSSARRLRRRVGDRRSLQFPDPPPPRIEELEEPTSDDELLAGESLARELPYYTLEYISMEVDSP